MGRTRKIYLHFHEESYNSFPHVLTTYNGPGIGKDFSLELESQYIRYTCNKSGVPVRNRIEEN